MSSHVRRQHTPENSLPSQMLALEPRYLFDAAAVTTAVDVSNDPSAGAPPPVAAPAAAADLLDDGQFFIVSEAAAQSSTAVEVTNGFGDDNLINKTPGTGTLTYTVTGGTGMGILDVTPDGAIEVSDPSRLDFESTPGTPPTLTLEIQATDDSLDTDTTTVTIVIINSQGEAPGLNGTTGDEIVGAGNTLTKDIKTEADPFDDDPQDQATDNFNYALLNPPDNASIDSTTGVLTWDTGTNQIGTTTVTVLISNLDENNVPDPDQTTVVQFDVTVSPLVSISGVTTADNTEVTEGESAEFIVKLNGASGQPASVTLSAIDGTADASDYDGTQFYLDANRTLLVENNVLSFTAGVTEISIFAGTTDNDPQFNEPDETFTVTATATTGSAGTGTATGTIMDGTLPVVSISGATTADGTTAPEGGAAKFTVALSGASAQTATVSLAAANGTATSTDYNATQFFLDQGLKTPVPNNVLSFATGVTAIDVYAGINSDAVVSEPNETFTLTATAAAGATGAGVVTGTIIDTTPVPTTATAIVAPASEPAAASGEPGADTGEGSGTGEDNGTETEGTGEETTGNSNPDAQGDGTPAGQGDEVSTEEAAQVEAEIEAFVAKADFSETTGSPAAGKPESQPQPQTRTEEVAEILSIMDKAAALVHCGG